MPPRKLTLDQKYDNDKKKQIKHIIKKYDS